MCFSISLMSMDGAELAVFKVMPIFKVERGNYEHARHANSKF